MVYTGNKFDSHWFVCLWWRTWRQRGIFWKGDVVHICSMYKYTIQTYKKLFKAYSLLLLGPGWSFPLTLDKSPLALQPSPYFPTLSIYRSPGQRHHVQRPSQRTSWYSLAPTMEERNIKPYALESLLLTFLLRQAQSLGMTGLWEAELDFWSCLFKEANCSPLPSQTLGTVKRSWWELDDLSSNAMYTNNSSCHVKSAFPLQGLSCFWGSLPFAHAPYIPAFIHAHCAQTYHGCTSVSKEGRLRP